MSVLRHESDQPLSNRQQLLSYFTEAEKPKEQWLIGVEHEKFSYRLNTLTTPSYEESNGLRDLMEEMRSYGWQAMWENGTIIGLSRDRATITFEPGGQIELGSSPVHSLHETEAELQQHLQEINVVGEKLGIGFLGVGFHPTAKRDDIPWPPKARYKIMRAYMPKRGGHGLDMMLRTCSVQVSLDYANEADMAKKFRVALALQPVATALFASSPFSEGKANGFNSYRMQMWQDTDPDRTGAPEFVYEPDFGYERYIDYALDVPMYFVYRNNAYVDCSGQSFRDFMAGQLPTLPGERPTMTDWANHLTTLFPDVRLKKVIELRGADAGRPDMIQALPAFWVGLLYDNAAIDAAWDLIKDWKAEDRSQLRPDVLRQGLRAQIAGRTVHDLAKDLLDLSRQSLQRRAIIENGQDESRYLAPLLAIADKGRNRADELLERYRDNFDAKSFFAEGRLLAAKG